MIAGEIPGFADPRPFLGRHGLRPKDSFGQCFLVAPPVAQNIVAALDPRADEHVIEIGTGPGTLATMIAPYALRVTAIERDRDLVAALAKEPLAANVTVLEEDAAAFDYAAACAEGPTAIVGNLPYAITGKLIRAILAPPIKWRCAVVMVQKEVALRLLASPGDDDWGVLGVFTHAACTVTRVTEASPRCFHPAPRVTSMVVRFAPRDVPLAEETPALQRLVRALFASRRKTTANGLGKLVGKERARAMCVALGIDPMRRPETLAVEELGALAGAMGG